MHCTIAVEKRVMAKNDQLAGENRARFHRAGVRAINVLSSPGSGKTALLERTLKDLQGKIRMGVIVGDLATDNDGRRLGQFNAPVVQLTTGRVCHLEADMVARGCDQLDLSQLEVLFIENVGNLVCPAGFDLGEDLRVVLLSTTEGEDKPLKYPTMFKSAQVVIITKMDLAEAVGFDRGTALHNIRAAAPQARILEVSARTGWGCAEWLDMVQFSKTPKT